MKKLLIATTNPGKLAEIRLFLKDLKLDLPGLKDVYISGHSAENGQTFEQNAVIKAKFYCQKSGLPTLADDGGFEIDALAGEPGVKSHRWINQKREDTDGEIITYIFKRMNGIKNRAAGLRAVIAFYTPEGHVATATDSVRGVVADEPSGKLTPGFPYRSVLFLPEIGKYYDHGQLTVRETQKYNHRQKILAKLKPIIRDYFQLP
ncbi:hypothetical protein A2154_05100 [Candidatus Gottesmanbacteria bacterium RBG_16_43_7]|uniref:Non-canonical purine NTP pyrophosphatase n=1 Tax=Candidatus Gottesmanbacteria bacterium RBG_16_43_7 TaxID=1798373 RepID=A0A1F5ZBK4_9BACT|nr:MAG: hypothetical protein A2154_05100 [Candidatus Gottesmanbacteria bacterium RBG_16_43_7]